MTDTVSVPIEVVKMLMELHYGLSRQHQQVAADLEARLREAMFPKAEPIPEVVEEIKQNDKLATS